jgi:hypothetical protein
LILGSRRSRQHYGAVAKGNAAGLLLHAALAVEAGTQALLGLVWMQVWNRGKGSWRLGASGRRLPKNRDGGSRAHSRPARCWLRRPVSPRYRTARATFTSCS